MAGLEHNLIRRARLRLAGLSLLVMGSILYAAGFSMGRLLLQAQEQALQSELVNLAGTLHLGRNYLTGQCAARALPGG
jgi:hypothetical protein